MVKKKKTLLTASMILFSAIAFSDYLVPITKNYEVGVVAPKPDPDPDPTPDPTPEPFSIEIIENPNGRCKKFSDGFLECWGTTEQVQSAGSLIVNYPHSFKSGSLIRESSLNDTYTIHITLSSNDRTGYSGGSGKSGSVGLNDHTYFTVSSESGASNSYSWYANGYWK